MPSDYQFAQQENKYEGKWLRFLEYQYLDPEGNEHTWQLVERTTRAGPCDASLYEAVDILAVFKASQLEDRIVLVKQYRPPLKGYTIEMPAGLVDQGETQEEAAVRELLEETGYSGVVIGKASPLVVSDPGLTNANLQLVTVHIDGDLDANQAPKPAIKDSFIETIILPLNHLKQALDQCVAGGFHVDSRLYHFAMGLHYSQYFLR